MNFGRRLTFSFVHLGLRNAKSMWQPTALFLEYYQDSVWNGFLFIGTQARSTVMSGRAWARDAVVSGRVCARNAFHSGRRFKLVSIEFFAWRSVRLFLVRSATKANISPPCRISSVATSLSKRQAVL